MVGSSGFKALLAPFVRLGSRRSKNRQDEHPDGIEGSAAGFPATTTAHGTAEFAWENGTVQLPQLPAWDYSVSVMQQPSGHLMPGPIGAFVVPTAFVEAMEGSVHDPYARRSYAVDPAAGMFERATEGPSAQPKLPLRLTQDVMPDSGSQTGNPAVAHPPACLTDGSADGCFTTNPFMRQGWHSSEQAPCSAAGAWQFSLPAVATPSQHCVQWPAPTANSSLFGNLVSPALATVATGAVNLLQPSLGPDPSDRPQPSQLELVHHSSSHFHQPSRSPLLVEQQQMLGQERHSRQQLCSSHQPVQQTDVRSHKLSQQLDTMELDGPEEQVKERVLVGEDGTSNGMSFKASSLLIPSSTQSQQLPAPHFSSISAPVPSPRDVQGKNKVISVAAHCPAELHGTDWSIDEFTLLRKLYEGNLSVVCQAQHKRSGKHVALKIYKRSRLHEMERFQLAREICLHIRLLHPYIITLYAAWKDSKYVYLVLEWAPRGNLFDYLVAQGGKLSEAEAAQVVMWPLLTALLSLHEQQFIHRDIKLENIILDGNCNIKLADFGLAIDLKYEQANTRLGTFGYFAPEVLDCPLKKGPFDYKNEGLKGYNSKVDIWSAGVVAYEVLTGKAPFSASSAPKILEAIRNRQLEYPPDLSAEAQDFLQRALTRDPEQRPCAHDLLSHSWMLHHCGALSVGFGQR